MSNDAITLNQQYTFRLLEDLAAIEQAIARLRQSLAGVLPAPYGSDSWWEKSDTKSIDSIKRGRGKRFATPKEAINYLHA